MEGYINLRSETELLAVWMKDPVVLNAESQLESRGVGPTEVSREECPKCSLLGKADQLARFPISGHVIWLAKSIVEHRIEKTRGLRPGSVKRGKNLLGTFVIPTQLLNHLIFQNEWEEGHVAHVANFDSPGIVAFGGLYVEKKPMLFAYLIDGTHRAVAAMRAGREFRAYCLVPRDVAICGEATNQIMQQPGMVSIDPAELRGDAAAKLAAMVADYQRGAA